MSNIAETITGNGFKEYQINGEFLRLMNAAGPVEIVYYANGAELAKTGVIQAGYAESFEKGEGFSSFRVYDRSGAANAVEILHRLKANVRYDRAAGNVKVEATRAAPVHVDQVPEAYGGSWSRSALEAANVPVQIVAPGANVNGIILHRASFATGSAAAYSFSAFVAKASAPASATDGDVLCSADSIYNSGAAACCAGKVEKDLFISPGKGLFFISPVAESIGFKSALYTIL